VSAAALCPVTVATLAQVGVVIVWTFGASVGAGVVAGVGARVCPSIGAGLGAGISSQIAGGGSTGIIAGAGARMGTEIGARIAGVRVGHQVAFRKRERVVIWVPLRWKTSYRETMLSLNSGKRGTRMRS
jgi:hypothetical protein